MLDQAQVDQRIALNGDSPNQFLGRDRDSRRRLGTNVDRPKQYQKSDACRKDESLLKRAHKQGWARKYTTFVKECSTSATGLRARLRVSWHWTYPVERCILSAVQIPTDAFIHFYPVRCTQYIVCDDTRGRPNVQCSPECFRGGGRKGRGSSIEQCLCKSLRNRGAECCHY